MDNNTIADYQNYQILKDTVTRFNINDNWVELGSVFCSVADVINYAKGNILAEAMEQQEHIVEYWNDDSGPDPDEWMDLEDFIEKYNKLTQANS